MTPEYLEHLAEMAEDAANYYSDRRDLVTSGAFMATARAAKAMAIKERRQFV